MKRDGLHPTSQDVWCADCSKNKHLTRRRAEEVANRQGLRLYPCPSGGGFHLGHRPRAEKQSSPTRGRELFEGSFEDMQKLAEQMRGA